MNKMVFKKGYVPWSKGRKLETPSKETKLKMSLFHKGQNAWNKGKKVGKNFKHSEFMKGKTYAKGHIVSEIVRKSMSEKHKGKIGYWRNKHRIVSEEQKKKLRMSAFEYVKRVRDILYPCIGHNEKEILDKLEQELNYKIIRQYQVDGYWVDGYCKELNIVFEVDEQPKIKEKDIVRQKIIEDKLNCKFIRIKDYD